MKLCIYSFKGGVGKTSIALNLAIELNAGIVTNDISTPIRNVLGDKRTLQIMPGQTFPNINEDIDLIYDLGGYADKRAIEEIKKADLVIIPTFKNESPDLSTCIESVKEIQKFNTKILIIANKVKKGHYDYIKESLEAHFNYPILPLNDSTALQRIFGSEEIIDGKRVFKNNSQALSISQLAQENKLLAHSYRKVLPQFQKIIAFINSNYFM